LGCIYILLFELLHNGGALLNASYYLQLLAFSGLSWVVSSLLFKTYMVQRVRNVRLAARKMFQALSFFIVIYFGYNVIAADFQSSTFFHLFFISAFTITMLLMTMLRHQLIFRYRALGGNYVPCIIISPERIVDDLWLSFEQNLLSMGYRLDDQIELKNDPDDYSNLRSFFGGNNYSTAFIFNPSRINDLEEILSICDNHGVRSKIIPKYSKSIAQRFESDSIAGYAVLDIRYEPLLYLHNKLFKRILDIILAILSIIFVLTWLPIVTKIFQMISSPGPLFFKQLRVGIDGHPFTIYKFRTMAHNAKRTEDAFYGKDASTKKDDDRVYWFGKILRKTNLDEYPQFINVLIGQMSVIGPRPHMLYEDKALSAKIPRYPVRRFVKPGISGWAQIHGYRGGSSSINEMAKRITYDIDYVENWTLWLDIKIIAITIWQMITFRIPSAY
jgi:putative colanic acid biosynthesis UDP-glucose lipid carrier transferase